MRWWQRLFGKGDRSAPQPKAVAPSASNEGDPSSPVSVAAAATPNALPGTFPQDLFISYAHEDNKRGQVRELRSQARS